jgi:anti-sigma regulatory factor (Ser/Thr protein kinase)
VRPPRGPLNTAFSDLRPWTLLCPYDIRQLPAAAVAGACQTHRLVSDHQGAYTSATYGYGWPQLGDELPPVPRRADELAFSAVTLRAARTWAADQATARGMRAARIDDVVLAVGELCANSVLHGGGHGWLRVWSTGDVLVYEVTDTGVVTDPLAGRRWPDPDDDRGRGLWLANKLCDLVQLRSAATGTRVRVHLRLQAT